MQPIVHIDKPFVAGAAINFVAPLLSTASMMVVFDYIAADSLNTFLFNPTHTLIGYEISVAVGIICGVANIITLLALKAIVINGQPINIQTAKIWIPIAITATLLPLILYGLVVTELTVPLALLATAVNVGSIYAILKALG